MQLTQDTADFRYVLRGVGEPGVLVNDSWIDCSFFVSPDTLVSPWRPRSVTEMSADDMQPLLELRPAVVLLGTGRQLTFPSQAVMAACLIRGIGLEVMDNAAAARTFNVLATEGRQVVAGFLLP